ncbi:VOC family protein [Streptomyces sp. NPDC006184]|uniref:VOC family protein n=1 Tax=Streptomyces sp. NPDC006184 TaxID=3155455 RepID=UPI0033A05A6D
MSSETLHQAAEWMPGKALDAAFRQRLFCGEDGQRTPASSTSMTNGTASDAAGTPVVAFRRVEDFRAPRWTDSAHPQQMHIDVMVTHLDVAEAQVLALGATLLDGSDKPIGYRVYEDPVGHPFCLITPEGA